uniref:Response regulatory domain-containing protein n=1 Tax=Haptolina brevifila TaxID=156173 RepID=A0A7S2NA74_9EUKA|mmetsp:Transcript_71698/g.142163  ORF Transcript_71698/g.142163 Transcript_71698/m.142163 type:complete len:108 (+) Transcript_71698:328-651(+)
MSEGGLKGTDVSRSIRQMEATEHHHMPDGEGDDLWLTDDRRGAAGSRKLRESSRAPILLICVSGNAGLDGFAEVARESGIDTVLSKPLADDIGETVTRLVLSRLSSR